MSSREIRFLGGVFHGQDRQVVDGMTIYSLPVAQKAETAERRSYENPQPSAIQIAEYTLRQFRWRNQLRYAMVAVSYEPTQVDMNGLF